jgi:hypothetical protein
MSVTEQDILSAALTLDADARARIIDKLLESLHGATPPDVEAAWQREIEDRVAADERGELESFSLDETMRHLEERLRGRRSG